MKKFTVKMYHYISGEMQLIIKEFEELEEAILAGVKSCAHSFKVFDCDGCVCHDSNGCCDTYA